MKPSQLADGQRLVVAFPLAGIDYTFTRDGLTCIWFGACIAATHRSVREDEDPNQTQPQVALSRAGADDMYRRFAALPGATETVH